MTSAPLIPQSLVVWSTVAGADLSRADWAVDSSVFDASTGETHLLGPLPMAILALLCVRRLSFGALCTELAAVCETGCDIAWASKIERLLNDLASLELVEANETKPGPRSDAD